MDTDYKSSQTRQCPHILRTGSANQSANQKDEETTLPAQRPDMAPWGDAKLFFCILFITCCTVTLAQIPIDCCLSVTNKTIGKHRVVDYSRQISGQGCALDAMIFVARRGRKLCVPADEPWIEEVMKYVDALKIHCKKHKYKGKPCSGMKRE